jgi:transposase
MIKRRKYSREFKIKAVELAEFKGDVIGVAADLNIRSELLHRWKREFAANQQKSFPGNGTQLHSEQELEVIRLKRELADVRMERDILKKAISIFSKNDGTYSDL